VRGSEVHAPLSPQQRQATQAAAPTLRLKLRPGSDAQASAPGSEDEDASRVRPSPTAVWLSPPPYRIQDTASSCSLVRHRACLPSLLWHKRGLSRVRPLPWSRWSLTFWSLTEPLSADLPEPACSGTSASADSFWCSEGVCPHSACYTVGVLLQPTGEAGAASRADGQEAQSPRPASAAHRAAAAAAAAALADGDAHVAAQHPRALVTAAPAAVQAREPEETAGPREHAERAASVAAAPAAVQESGQRDASDAPGRDTAPASQSADRGGAEPAPSGAAAAGAPQGAEVAEPRSPAAPTPPLDCRPDQAQGPAGSSGGGGEAAAGGAGAKRGREGDAGVAADTKGALPGTEDSTGLADDPAAAAAHKRARLGEGPGGDGAALSAGGAPPGHVSDGVPAPEAANGATP